MYFSSLFCNNFTICVIAFGIVVFVFSLFLNWIARAPTRAERMKITFKNKNTKKALSLNTFCSLSLSVLPLFLDGQSEVEVRLVVRKYVDKGTSVTLHCEHNVPAKILYKVRVWCVWRCVCSCCTMKVCGFERSHTHNATQLYVVIYPWAQKSGIHGES